MLPNQVDGIAHAEMSGLTTALQLFRMACATGCLHICRACCLGYHPLVGQALVICCVIALVAVGAGKVMGAVELYLAMTGLTSRHWQRWGGRFLTAVGVDLVSGGGTGRAFFSSSWHPRSGNRKKKANNVKCCFIILTV